MFDTFIKKNEYYLAIDKIWIAHYRSIAGDEIFCVLLFSLWMEKIQSPPFSPYSSLPPLRDNHINLLNLKDIISMSATLPFFIIATSFGNGSIHTVTSARTRLIMDRLPYCASDVSLVMNTKKPLGELVYGNEINLLRLPRLLKTYMIYHLWVGGCFIYFISDFPIFLVLKYNLL